MTQAQLKSGALIEELTPSLIKGELLINEMDVHRIIREAKRIPERYQGLSIEGLARITLGQIEDGCELCERALSLAPNDPVSLCNYTIALRNKGLHLKQNELLAAAVNSLNPKILYDIVANATYWADIRTLNRALPMLIAMNLPSSVDLHEGLDTIKYYEKHEWRVDDMTSIGKLMMAISDKHRLRLAASQMLDINSELNALVIEVKTEDPVFISMLNDELTNEILSAGLANSECVGYFEAGDF